MSDPNIPLNNFTYLGLEASWLHARAARIGGEERLREDESDNSIENHVHRVGRGRPVRSDAGRLDLVTLREREDSIREDLDNRLAAHHADKSLPMLGLDKLGQDFGLGPDERMVLLVVGVVGLSPRWSEEVFEPLGLFAYAFEVQNLIPFISPSPTVEDLVRVRRLFRWDAPLVRNGLVVVDYGTRCYLPRDFAQAAVSISAKGLAGLTGAEDILSEAPGGGS
ncbi:MAG: hypothetical protein HYV07_28695 [Deltaproteobacteria bacterium]|nr:hypothetical protein [Deltaproteobacteria bacterium]